MDTQLAVLFALTFLINLIGSLAYSVRIAGVRTGRIALSFSLFNILVLVSRTANTFQAPLLAKRVEHQLGTTHLGSVADFRWLLAAASLATIVGALLTPTFQRLFTTAVASFARHRSVPQLMLRALSPVGLAHFRDALALPTAANVVAGRRIRATAAVGIMATNTLATAVWTVGVFAALYAGYLAPEFRSTASNLSGVINGGATILLFAVVDPFLAMLTDDVVGGRSTEPAFRRAVVGMLGSRFVGTVLAQLLLVPAAHLVATLARSI
ncbi:MAG: lipid II flippase Amj family protein [bacterium]